MRLHLLFVLAASSAAYVLPALRPVAPLTPICRKAVPCMQVDDEAQPPVEPPADAVEPPTDAAEEAVEVTAEEPAVEFESPFGADEDVEAEFDEGSIAKEALKAEIADGLTGERPDKAVVGEILLALEAQNPTPSPATSSLLNGRWKFVYASGASPGLKALMLVLKGAKSAPKSPSGADIVDVADTYLTIRAEQPRATAEVKIRLLSFENTVKLSSKLEAESAVRLVETYDAAESDYMNLKLPFQSPVEYKRSVLISYLDDEMLVVRDSNGRPDVLMRIPDETAFPSSDVDTAAAADAPGAS